MHTEANNDLRALHAAAIQSLRPQLRRLIDQLPPDQRELAAKAGVVGVLRALATWGPESDPEEDFDAYAIRCAAESMRIIVPDTEVVKERARKFIETLSPAERANLDPERPGYAALVERAVAFVHGKT